MYISSPPSLIQPQKWYRVPFGSDEPFEIKIISSDFNDRRGGEFCEEWLPDILHPFSARPRAVVIEALEEFLGKTILDYGNTSPLEAFMLLRQLATRPELIPGEVQYVVFGHAYGRHDDNSWTFVGKGERIDSFLEANVPKGQKVFVIACQTHDPEYFADPQGVILSA